MDNNFLENILNTVAKQLNKKKIKLKFKRYQIHEFVNRWKKYLNINHIFNEDEDFPYSDHIENELNLLIDCGLLEYFDINKNIYIWNSTNSYKNIDNIIIHDFKLKFLQE